MTKITIEQNWRERRVKRWKQIVRRIHSAKPIEDRAEPPDSVRARESKTQREKQKTKACNENRGDHPPQKNPQLLLCSTKERGRDEEEVDRHIGENHERKEWDGTLPLKIERAYLTALSRDPIATAVDDQKQDRQFRRNSERFKTRDVHAMVKTSSAVRLRR